MSAPAKHRLLLAAAWGATILATFALGRWSGPGFSRTDRQTKVSKASETRRADVQESSADVAAMESELSQWFGSKASSLAEVLGQRTLEEHVKSLLKIDDEATRMLGFLRLMEAINSADQLKAALDVLAADRSNRFRVTEQAMLLQKWAGIDAKGAADYTAALRDWARVSGMSAVMRTWLKSSPDEAIAWAEKNGAPPTDDARAREEGNWVVGTLVDLLAKTNLDRALHLANDQTVSRARGRMVDTLVNELLAQRGEDSARGAVLDLPDDAFRAGMAGRLAEKLASGDPQKAAGWAATLPEGATRERAVAEVIGEWAQKDPVAAGNYLTQYSTLRDFDDARQRYAGEVLRTDPEGALAWAHAITDEKQRTNAMRDLLRNWMRRDPQNAQQWAVANGMAEQPRDTVIKVR